MKTEIEQSGGDLKLLKIYGLEDWCTVGRSLDINVQQNKAVFYMRAIDIIAYKDNRIIGGFNKSINAGWFDHALMHNINANETSSIKKIDEKQIEPEKVVEKQQILKKRGRKKVEDYLKDQTVGNKEDVV